MMVGKKKGQSWITIWDIKHWINGLWVALKGKFSFFQPLFAFEYKEVFPENGWKVYDPTWEYRRQVGIVPHPSSSSTLQKQGSVQW